MSLHKLSRGIALTAVIVGSLTAGHARAADLDPALEDPIQDISAMPVSNVTFGTGWYVRGDFGGAELLKANPFTSGALNYGPTTFYSNAPGVTLSRSHDLGYVADLGAGYSFTPWFRADVLFDFHQPVHSNAYGKPFACQIGYLADGSPYYGGSCNGVYQARLQSYDALVNGYFDLGTWYRVTPYVGAGVGLGFGHFQTASNYFQADGTSYDVDVTNPGNGQTYHINFDRNASGTYYNFAYAAMAGIAVQVFDHTKLDIGYRYLNQGRVLGTKLDEHEVRAGLRYMIDN